jgi:hypothetical protein
MSDQLKQEFLRKQMRLIALCEKIAQAVTQTEYPYASNARACLLQESVVIKDDSSLDDKRASGGSIRSLFHKEGFYEYPGPPDYPNWEAEVDELYNLSWLYAESKYRELYSELTDCP